MHQNMFLSFYPLQEREDKHRLQATLAEEQLGGAAARAALQVD